MAKDLPYFKFFCSEWNDGDITLEEFNIQGLFINVCSYYWSNECYLHIDKLKKRFKHNVKNVEYLLESGFLHNENGYLAIHFLDEQQEERKSTSKRNSAAGKKSAERRRLAKLQQDPNENPTPVEKSLNGNSTNKKREEERREDNTKSIDFDGLLVYINKKLNRQFRTINKDLKSKYKARLRDGYTKEDIIQAINNASNDTFHKQKNYQYLTPEFFSRATTLDKFSTVTEVKEENLNATVRTVDDVKKLWE